MSTLTAVDVQGTRIITVDEYDLELLPLVETIYRDLSERAPSFHRRSWDEAPFSPNLKGWLDELINGLKCCVVVERGQPARAINFMLQHGIIRVALVEQEVLANKATFLCINADRMPIITEWGPR